MTTQPAEAMERRVSRLEGAYEQVNERMGEMNQRLNEMNQRLNVHLMLIGGVWATVLGGFIALFFRG